MAAAVESGGPPWTISLEDSEIFRAFCFKNTFQ